MKTRIENIRLDKFDYVLADEIIFTINQAIEEKGSCTISLAGGKTPASIYGLLAIPPRVNEVDWSKVYFFYGDERFVSTSDTRNNFNMSKERFFSAAKINPDNVFYMNTNLATAKETALAYQETLKTELMKHNQEIAFDLVLLGMGQDLHFASIFPNSEVFNDNTENFVFDVINTSDQSQRVTLSHKVIFNSKLIYFIVKGKAKTDALKKVFELESFDPKFPASIYNNHLDKVIWFIDSEAGFEI